MSDTEQRTLSGAAIGTAAGGVVGAIAGHTGMGLAVGAAAGAAGGYLYDHHEKAKKEAHDRSLRERLRRTVKRVNRVKGRIMNYAKSGKKEKVRIRQAGKLPYSCPGSSSMKAGLTDWVVCASQLAA